MWLDRDHLWRESSMAYRGQTLHRTWTESPGSCINTSSNRENRALLERKGMIQNITDGYFVYSSTYVVLVSKSFKIRDFNVK
jgi:hypothetical protein